MIENCYNKLSCFQLSLAALVTLYLNGMSKPTKDTDDILRIKDKQKSEIRLFRQNVNLVIKFKDNYKDVITIMELFSGN